MTNSNGSDLDVYYQHIQDNGYLRTQQAAQRWSKAVLWTLGLNLDRRTKKRLAETLPDELATNLTRAFWLLNFRDKSKTQETFLKEIAKRSGNTDAEFARHPTMAIFHEVKGYAGEDLSDDVADSLAPDISALWQQA